jgi:hypothetical protein
MIGRARTAFGIEIVAPIAGHSEENISLEPVGKSRLADFDQRLPSRSETKLVACRPRSKSKTRHEPPGPIRPDASGARSPARKAIAIGPRFACEAELAIAKPQLQRLLISTKGDRAGGDG